MNGYKAFYNGKTLEVRADSSYAAQLLAAKRFKARRPHDVTVMLCEVGDQQVTHSTAEI